MVAIKTYKVAEHLFQIGMDADSGIWEKMDESYGPFDVSDHIGSADYSKSYLFRLMVCEAVELENMALLYSNKDTVELGFPAMEVYKGEDGFCIELTLYGSEKVNVRLAVGKDFKEAKMTLAGNMNQKWYAFNLGVNFCFMVASAPYDTVLAHASCVSYKGKAWLFLGKSGTGKSTHSRMWLSALEGVVLMNDDHPVLRINDSRQVIAYGSPWSGKTRCYKNVEAPVGGIIRISRAPYNRARRLSVIESYASLMTSFSSMTWEKELADGRDRTIQGIISTVSCWVMECLPDADAALVCSQTVTEA